MSSHLADSALYGHLWTTPELHALVDDRGRTQGWLEVLAAWAAAQAEVGLLPPGVAEDIAARMDASSPRSGEHVNRMAGDNGICEPPA